MRKDCCLIACALAAASLLGGTSAFAQGDLMAVNPGTPWPATDALGRKLPMPDEVGPPVSGRFVGIFYFLWHNRPEAEVLHPDGPNDITRSWLAIPTFSGSPTRRCGNPPARIYWGEALYGYDFMVNRTMDRGERGWKRTSAAGAGRKLAPWITGWRAMSFIWPFRVRPSAVAAGNPSGPRFQVGRQHPDSRRRGAEGVSCIATSAIDSPAATVVSGGDYDVAAVGTAA